MSRTVQVAQAIRGGMIAGLVVVVVAAGCAGSAEGTAKTAGQLSVGLELPKVGNPRYDRFFTDAMALQREVAELRAQLDRSPKAVNRSLGLRAGTSFRQAMTRLSAKLFGKVKVQLVVTPAGAEVDLAPVRGVELNDADMAAVATYKQVVTELGAIPARVRPLGEKTASLIGQAIDLAKRARTDFTGLAMLRTLPSVIKGIVQVKDAIAAIKNDLPVVVTRTESMLLEAKRSMGLEPKVELGINVASLFDEGAIARHAAGRGAGGLDVGSLTGTAAGSASGGPAALAKSGLGKQAFGKGALNSGALKGAALPVPAAKKLSSPLPARGKRG